MDNKRNKLTNKSKYPAFVDYTTGLDFTTVLDYGSNQGNLLYFSNGSIDVSGYTGIDVDLDSITSAQQQFPGAEFIHSNKYNWMYNPSGEDIQLNDVTSNEDFDVVWSYSVFSHTDFDDLIQALDWFTSFNYKKIIVSVLDIDNKYALDHFYSSRMTRYGECVDFRNIDSDILYLKDNDRTITNVKSLAKDPCDLLLAFYNIDWLLTQLKNKYSNVSIEYPGVGVASYICIS